MEVIIEWSKIGCGPLFHTSLSLPYAGVEPGPPARVRKLDAGRTSSNGCRMVARGSFGARFAADVRDVSREPGPRAPNRIGPI